MDRTVHTIADLLNVVETLPQDAQHRVLAGAKAVLAMPTLAPYDREQLTAALVRCPALPLSEAHALFGQAGPIEARHHDIADAMFGRRDITADVAADLVRRERRKTVRRELATVVRSVALADALAGSDDAELVFALLGSDRLPDRWRVQTAVAVLDPRTGLGLGYKGTSKVLSCVRTVGMDAMLLFLEQVAEVDHVLSLCDYESAVAGQRCWEAVAGRLIADAQDVYEIRCRRPLASGALYTALRRIAVHADVPVRERLAAAFDGHIDFEDGRPLRAVLRLPLEAEAEVDVFDLSWDNEVLRGRFGTVRPAQVLAAFDEALGDDPQHWVTLVSVGQSLHGSAGQVLGAVRGSLA